MSQQYIGTGRLSTVQTIATTASSLGATNAFGAQTYKVRVVANTAVHVKIGDGSQTAAATDSFVPANSPEYFTVTPGQKIAAIRAATGGLVTATDGTTWVTELV